MGCLNVGPLHFEAVVFLWLLAVSVALAKRQICWCTVDKDSIRFCESLLLKSVLDLEDCWPCVHFYCYICCVNTELSAVTAGAAVFWTGSPDMHDHLKCSVRFSSFFLKVPLNFITYELHNLWSLRAQPCPRPRSCWAPIGAFSGPAKLTEGKAVLGSRLGLTHSSWLQLGGCTAHKHLGCPYECFP